jgi:hypothetical protein
MSEEEASEGAPETAEPPPKPDEGNAASELTIPFNQFLETVHPSVAKNVSGLWSESERRSGGSRIVDMNTPNLRLHCEQCDGERTFRCRHSNASLRDGSPTATFITYTCGDCLKQAKSFSLWLYIGNSEGQGRGTAYKYGEHPPFGVPVPNKVLRLFGEDRANFLKGRQCENQGLGVGAFAYYRRVVENHKNEIFDEIIRVCETLGAFPELIEELRNAKKERQFTEAIDQIKTALPDGLLINGRNPLLALHGALSVGLHKESDEECLKTANAVRLVLTDLVERLTLLRLENRELQSAVERLIAKKGGVSEATREGGA